MVLRHDFSIFAMVIKHGGLTKMNNHNVFFYKLPNKPLLLDNINFLIWHTREQRTFYTHLSAARTYKTIGQIEFVCF